MSSKKYAQYGIRGGIRVASYNVLADAYVGYGEFGHVDQELLKPGARRELLVKQITDLEADVVGLQEADRELLEAFDDEYWQKLWTPKGRNKPDGCLTLVRKRLRVIEHESYEYPDDTGHVYQITKLAEVAIANTHFRWAKSDEPYHAGIHQALELLDTLKPEEVAVVLADVNDHPNGPIRRLFEFAGFTDLNEGMATAYVDGLPESVDVIAVKGLKGYMKTGKVKPLLIPNVDNPSDHIPLVADVKLKR